MTIIKFLYNFWIVIGAISVIAAFVDITFIHIPSIKTKLKYDHTVSRTIIGTLAISVLVISMIVGIGFVSVPNVSKMDINSAVQTLSEIDLEVSSLPNQSLEQHRNNTVVFQSIAAKEIVPKGTIIYIGYLENESENIQNNEPIHIENSASKDNNDDFVSTSVSSPPAISTTTPAIISPNTDNKSPITNNVLSDNSAYNNESIDTNHSNSSAVDITSSAINTSPPVSDNTTDESFVQTTIIAAQTTSTAEPNKISELILCSDEKTKKYGYMDNKCNIVIPCIYIEALFFSEGLAAVKAENGKWGFINTEGDVVIPFEYIQTGNFVNGYAPVQKNNKWGFIDFENKTVIPFVYLSARDFSEDFAAVRNEEGNWGFINNKNETVISFSYHGALDFVNGLAPVFKNNLYGFIDKNEKIVIPYRYENVMTITIDGKSEYHDQDDNLIEY